MKKILLLIALMIPASCFAQSQVKIALGATYANGIINVIPLVFGQAVGTLTYSLDASGNIIIANLSQGRLHGVFVCKSTGTACLYTTVVPTGNTQDITSALSANPFGSATGTVTSSTMTSGTPTEASGANSIKNGVLADFITFGLAASSTLPFNVKSYGAKGDTKTVSDGVTTGSSPTVTSATASWTQADVGKRFFATQASNGNPTCGETTIQSVTNSTTAVLAQNCNFSLTGDTFVWGTDDTAAIQSAVNALVATTYGGTIYFPAGGYYCKAAGQACIQVGTQPFTSIGIIGDGSAATVIFASAGSTPASLGGILIQNTQNSSNTVIRGIKLEGSKAFLVPAGGCSGGCVPIDLNSSQIDFYDVWVDNFQGDGGSASWAISLIGLKGYIYGLRITSNQNGLLLNAESNFSIRGSLLSNSGGPNLQITNSGNASIVGNVTITDSLIDECGAASCTLLTGSTDIIFSNDVFFAGGSENALEVDGTSSARVVNSYVIPYDSRSNSTGMKVDSGGVVFASQTQFTGSGTGAALNNSGTFNDNGGNSFTGGITNTGTLSGPIFQGKITAPLVATSTNCSSAASPAVCASAAAGSVVVAAATTTVVVNTTAVTANSQIFLMFDSSLGTKLGVTCNATEPALYGVTARSAATSFTITSTAPTSNPACFSYFIVN